MTRAWISAIVWVGWAIYMFRGGPIWVVTLIEQMQEPREKEN